MIKVNLSEPSTWRGMVYVISGLGTLFGLIVDTNTALAVVGIGLTIAGAIGFSVPDVTEVENQLNELHH